MAPVTPPPVPARQPPSVYEVGGPSTAIAEGPSFPHLALGLSVPPFVIEDLSTRLRKIRVRAWVVVAKGSGDGVPNGSCCRQIGAGVVLADKCASERHTDPAATDYS
nr:hypothetical protein [Tanacetum cinerariifolium]